MIRKFFLRRRDGNSDALEADPKVVEVREVRGEFRVGDEVEVLYRGKVTRVYGDEVEVQDLGPVEIVRVVRS